MAPDPKWAGALSALLEDLQADLNRLRAEVASLRAEIERAYPDPNPDRVAPPKAAQTQRWGPWGGLQSRSRGG